MIEEVSILNEKNLSLLSFTLLKIFYFKTMKNLSRLLFVGILALAPVHVSGMMERNEKKIEETAEARQKKTEENSARNQVAAAKEAAEKGVTSESTIEIIEQTTEVIGEDISKESPLKSSPKEDRQAIRAVAQSDEESEDEDLFDPLLLEQRLQEARKVFSDLNKKGPVMEEATLRNLFQKWSERYERYQQALEALQKENNNAGLIEQQQNEPRLEKLEKLVKISQRTAHTFLRYFEASKSEMARIHKDHFDSFEIIAEEMRKEGMQKIRAERKEKSDQRLKELSNTLLELNFKLTNSKQPTYYEQIRKWINFKAANLNERIFYEAAKKWIEKASESVLSKHALLQSEPWPPGDGQSSISHSLSKHLASLQNTLSIYQHAAGFYYRKTAEAAESKRPDLLEWHRCVAAWLGEGANNYEKAILLLKDGQEKLAEDQERLARFQWDVASFLNCGTKALEKAAEAREPDLAKKLYLIANAWKHAASWVAAASKTMGLKEVWVGHQRRLANYQKNAGLNYARLIDAVKHTKAGVVELQKLAASTSAEAANSYYNGISLLKDGQHKFGDVALNHAINKFEATMMYNSAAVAAFDEKSDLANKYRWAADWFNDAAESAQKVIALLKERKNELANYQKKLSIYQYHAGLNYHEIIKAEGNQHSDLVEEYLLYLLKQKTLEEAAEDQQEAITLFKDGKENLARKWHENTDMNADFFAGIIAKRIAAIKSPPSPPYLHKYPYFYVEQNGKPPFVAHNLEKIRIKDAAEFVEPIRIPKSGAFYADELLLKELNEELKDLMVCNARKNMEEQNKMDIFRTKKLLIQDREKGIFSNLSLNGIINGYHDEGFNDAFQSKMQELASFLEDPHLAAVVLPLINQSLASIPSLVLSGAHRLSQGKQSRNGPITSHTTTGAIGFPEAKGPYDLKIEKIHRSELLPPYFLLSLDQKEKPEVFHKKRKMSGQRSMTIFFEPNIERTSTTKFEFNLVPTPNSFNPKKPYSKNNLPCTIKSLHFSNIYEIEELRDL